MRLIFLGFALCLTLAGQGTISSLPGLPLAGAPTTLVLNANPPAIGAVTWDFGDQQVLVGGPMATHIYARTGFYTVRAAYAVAVGQVTTAQGLIRVVSGQGPAAPFTISLLRLRWEDGRTDLSVTQGFSPLAAFADLKFEGTGLFQAQWTVDGIPLGIFTRQLAFAGQVTLDSGGMLSLPTNSPGEHLVSLKILSPYVAFQSPAIRYFVKLGKGEEAPRIDEIMPSVLRPGQEAELRITGKGLTRETRVSFGKDVALVSPLQFSEPGKAMAKVFVAPTAQPGLREVQAANRSGRTQGPAHLQVLPPPNATTLGGPSQAHFLFGDEAWMQGSDARRPTLLQALTEFFLLPADRSHPDEDRRLFPVQATQ